MNQHMLERLTGAVTKIREHGVPDDVWDEALAI